MTRRILWFVGLTVFAACTLVPPLINLAPLQRIGILTFGLENAQGPLGEMATQRFVQDITAAQFAVQVLELGPERELLDEIGEERLRPEAFRALKEKYGANAFFFGTIEVSDIKPEIDLLDIVKTLSVRASFTVSITARLVNAENGATLWTDSVTAKETIAEVSLGEGRIPDFGLRDQNEAYRQMIDGLVLDLTRDFRPHRRLF